MRMLAVATVLLVGCSHDPARGGDETLPDAGGGGDSGDVPAAWSAMVCGSPVFMPSSPHPTSVAMIKKLMRIPRA